MQDPAYGLPRITIPGTWVNNARKRSDGPGRAEIEISASEYYGFLMYATSARPLQSVRKKSPAA